MARSRKLSPAATYSYAEQLALYKEALAKLSSAQEVEIMGKRFRRVDMKEMRETVDWLERKVAAEASNAPRGMKMFEGRIA